jgi:hypothetical protein
MKAIICTALAALLIVSVPAVQAEMVTMEEALTVAENWIRLIIDTQGRWGDSDTAEVEVIDEYLGADQVVGYFCRVNPHGFIVVSLDKQLAPIKAYSATSDLDPLAGGGMSDLFKSRMAEMLRSLGQRASRGGSVRALSEQGLLEVDYRAAWRALGSHLGPSIGITSAAADEMRYEGGIRPLLTSRWTQGSPYNALCPAPPKATVPPGVVIEDDCDEEHCAVGCGPLAGAQVMRYWAWPPAYRWDRMPNVIWVAKEGGTLPPGYYDEDWISLSQAQIDAVAELCLDVGVAAGADYCGHDGAPCATGTAFAGAKGADLLDAFEEDFRYDDAAGHYDRSVHSAEEWFNLIKEQLNERRPILYCLKTHTIVCDGWQEFSGGGTTIRQYHMNYGWSGWVGDPSECSDWNKYGTSNAWYTLDELPCSAPDDEEMILDLYPSPSIGRRLDDTSYPKRTFNYRYFTHEASGSEATFEPGQNLQFLPGVGVTRRGDAAGGPIRFLGAAADPTRMYYVQATAQGALTVGIKIGAAAIRLYRNGRLGFLPWGPAKRSVELYDLGEPYRDFAPRTMSAGVDGQVFTIWGILENGGAGASGPFQVRFYASVDDLILEGDHVLGTADVPSIAGGKTFSFSVKRYFPTQIPKGTYYIGWIIDPDNEIGEINKSNNMACKEGYRLVVE